jgi:hypothetical protein
MSEIVFLDCEASSLHPSLSYPIEIAWGGPAGEIESHLITPYTGQVNWSDWDPQAEVLHGLSREFLHTHGESPAQVAKAMCRSLAGKTVYTDAPEYDGFWIRRLLVTALGDAACDIYIDHIDTLLTRILPKEYWEYDPTSTQPERHIESLCAQAQKSVISAGRPPHRAGNDVMYLRELYRIARLAGGWY